jgi:hypothetical protein
VLAAVTTGVTTTAAVAATRGLLVFHFHSAIIFGLGGIREGGDRVRHLLLGYLTASTAHEEVGLLGALGEGGLATGGLESSLLKGATEALCCHTTTTSRLNTARRARKSNRSHLFV